MVAVRVRVIRVGDEAVGYVDFGKVIDVVAIGIRVIRVGGVAGGYSEDTSIVRVNVTTDFIAVIDGVIVRVRIDGIG